MYKVTKKFPKEELFGITSQIRRSAASIGANIAEGFGRLSYKDKANYHTHANGSITEVKNHLLLARDLEYISQNDFDRLYLAATEAHKVLNGLIKTTRSPF
ncbi:MAG TPA: four helix bundle protein [Candidatus Paceibacterota bacterium]|nr:four helix bundle protein [Candidatus Paceibacterota bacterium]